MNTQARTIAMRTLAVLLCIASNAMAAKDGKYSIEQAVSDQAQLRTIAFSGLAFVTGDFGAATFLPPGKVCDYFGFQYMRDIDAQQSGHNPKFLNRVVGNVLQTLTPPQREILADLARKQAPRFIELQQKRWPVIKAFYRELSGDRPAGTDGLDDESIGRAVGEIFALDAGLSIERAEVYGKIVASLTPEQKQTLSRMKFGDFATWADVDANPYRMPRGTEKMVNVAYMTYASELFSWYAGSIEADTYFCPERHGTYFGGFYMKDMPAMGKRDFDISTSVTADSGQAFLELLTPEQRKGITDLPAKQRESMRRIVQIRREISTLLRVSLKGENIDAKRVTELGREYGTIDGRISTWYATAFSTAGRSMTDTQKQAAIKLRNLDGYTSAPAYLYSSPVRETPKIDSTDLLFRSAVQDKHP